MKDIKRISIIGGSGTGKTTLSNNLSKVLNIPAFHIDGMHHLDNWKVRDKNDRDKMIHEKVEKPEWIIDGTYPSTMDERLKKSDLVIFLDYSTAARLKGAVGRFIKNHGKEKPEIPGCKEKMDVNFIKMILKFSKEKRPKVIEKLNNIDKEKVIIFKNRNQLNKWFQEEFNKKMEL